MSAAYLIGGIILGAFLFWLYQSWGPSQSYPGYSDQSYYGQSAPYGTWGQPRGPAYGYERVRGRPPCGMPCGY
jgi:predicted GNAT superfamily acetyltransferase